MLMISCGNGDQKSVSYPHIITEFEELPEDFKDFHIRFHNDSIFQMNRINFPLRGLPAHFTEEDLHFSYDESEWVLHKPYDISTSSYKREWILSNENEIEEFIASTEADFGMSRTFKQSGGYWYLVYYAAMNRLNESGNPVGTQKDGTEAESTEENSIIDTISMEKL